jgi:hypothetical protein
MTRVDCVVYGLLKKHLHRSDDDMAKDGPRRRLKWYYIGVHTCETKELDDSSSTHLSCKRQHIQEPACQGPVITNNTFDHSVPQCEEKVTWGCAGIGSSNVDEARLAFHVASLSNLVENELFKGCHFP